MSTWGHTGHKLWSQDLNLIPPSKSLNTMQEHRLHDQEKFFQVTTWDQDAFEYQNKEWVFYSPSIWESLKVFSKDVTSLDWCSKRINVSTVYRIHWREKEEILKKKVWNLPFIEHLLSARHILSNLMKDIRAWHRAKAVGFRLSGQAYRIYSK